MTLLRKHGFQRRKSNFDRKFLHFKVMEQRNLLRNFRIKVGDRGDWTNFWKSCDKNWQDEAAAFYHELYERTTTLTLSCFYRAAWNADAVQRWESCLSVCLSICLSNAWIVTKRKKDLSRFLHHTKDHYFIPVFWEKEWLVGATPSTWNFGSPGPRWSEIADF